VVSTESTGPSRRSTETGAGVNAYIIDSGIRATHSDFGGRASGAVDFVGDGNGTNDCHGHGTNVAGIVGGSAAGRCPTVPCLPSSSF
jgi:subtilisin family serine protease